MRLCFLLLTLLVLRRETTPGRTALQHSPAASRDAARELVALEQRWNDAISQKDTAFVRQLLVPDFLFIGPDGSVNDKAAVLRAVASPAARVEPFQTQEVRVRLYGRQTAVLTGWFRQTGTWRGQPFTVSYRYTDVYVRRAGRWQAASAQATPLKQ